MTTTDNIEQLVTKSFLNRVPGIMEQHPELTFDEAVKAAFDHEESFLFSLMGPRSELSEVANTIIHELSDRTYHRLRSRR
jgi:hypothetical protein